MAPRTPAILSRINSVSFFIICLTEVSQIPVYISKYRLEN